MATAQDRFSSMVRDLVSPELRRMGFKGSGGRYELPSTTHWIVVGFQASQFSSADSMRFTVNCQVVRRDTWEEFRKERPYIGPKPKPNTVAGNFVWWTRIGSLMPPGEDQWWTLTAHDDIKAIAEDVLAAITQFVLPAIEREVSSTTG